MTLVLGDGAPVTVVAHGFGASSAETRVLVSGVPGTHVLPVARGHTGHLHDDDGRTGYAALAADLLAVCEQHSATRAIGMSLGAATLLRLLSEQPTRFERVVLLLPAVLDRPRVSTDRAADLFAGLRARDAEAVVRAVHAELPPGLVSRTVEAYVRARTANLLASPGLAGLLEELADEVPVPAPAVLGAVTADVLVIGQEGDAVHPAQVAREVAAALPRAQLVVFDQPGMLLRERDRLRTLIRDHLS